MRGVLSWVVSLAMIAAGAALIWSFFFGGGSGAVATNNQDPGGFNVPELSSGQDPSGGPEDKTLKLTVPDMSRIDDTSIPNAAGDDVEALDSNAGIHLEGTGFPWQQEANVYIAGHRLGYPNTESFLAFFDLQKLARGDKVYVTDANGVRYTYEVTEEFTVSPTDLSITEPVPGKNVLTLQTCTLPDYSERLVVRAELVDKQA
jgi:sortase A